MAEEINQGMVRVKSPDGEWGTVPSDKLDKAIESGYLPETPQDKIVNDYVVENQNLKGAIKVGVKSFLNQLAFDVPDTVEEMTSDPLERAKIEALKKEHRLATVVGGVPGFFASLPVGGPVAGAAGKAAGRLAESLLARTALRSGEEAIAGAGVKAAAKEIASRAIVKGAELGVEGAAFTAPVVLTEAVLGDPELAAETVAMNGIIGMTLGGAIGTASGLTDQAKPLFGKALEKYRSMLGRNAVQAAQSAGVGESEMVSKAISQGDKYTIKSGVQQSGEMQKASDDLLDYVYGSMKEKKITAPQISEAAQRQGIDLIPGMLEKDPRVRQMVSRLETSPSLPGNWAYEKVQNARNRIQDIISKDIVGMGADDVLSKNVSQMSLGEQIKQDFFSHIQKSGGGFGSAYEEFEEPFKKTGLIKKEFKNAIAELRDSVSQISEQESALKKDLTNRLDVIEKSKSVADLNREIRTLQDAARKAHAPANPDRALSNQLDLMISSLKEVRDVSAKKLKGGLAEKFQETQAMYREHKQMLAELADAAKLGRTADRGKIVQKLAELDQATLVDRLSQAKNNRGFSFLQKEMPETFQKISDYIKTDIATKSAKDGLFKVNGVLKMASKYQPEVAEQLFGKAGAQALKDIKVIADAVPNWMESNPSGTAVWKSLSDLNPLTFVGRNAQDLFQYNAIFNRESAGLRAVEQSMKKTAEALDKIPDAVTKLSKAGSRVEIREKKAISAPVKSSGFVPKAIPVGSSKTAEAVDTRQREIMSSLYRILGTEAQDKARKDKAEGKDPIRSAVEEAASRPDIIQDRLKEILGTLSTQGANKTAESLQYHALNTVKYLYNALPKETKPRDLTGMSKHIPSDYEVAKFAKKAEVVADPLVAIKKLESGSLTRDHIDALANVYPKLYSAMKTRILNYLTTEKPKLSYQGKSQLSVFLGMPVDQTMSPESILSSQKLHQNQPEPQGQPDFRPVNFKSRVADRQTIGEDETKP